MSTVVRKTHFGDDSGQLQSLKDTQNLNTLLP